MAECVGKKNGIGCGVCHQLEIGEEVANCVVVLIF